MGQTLRHSNECTVISWFLRKQNRNLPNVCAGVGFMVNDEVCERVSPPLCLQKRPHRKRASVLCLASAVQQVKSNLTQ